MPEENNGTTYDADTGQPIQSHPYNQRLAIDVGALMQSPITWLVVGVAIGVWLCKSKRV